MEVKGDPLIDMSFISHIKTMNMNRSAYLKMTYDAHINIITPHNDKAILILPVSFVPFYGR